jgi:hypothetical protein
MITEMLFDNLFIYKVKYEIFIPYAGKERL